MKYVFTGKKVNVPNYIQKYAEKKVGKLDRFFKEDATASLTFGVEKDRNQVEVTIRSSGTISGCRRLPLICTPASTPL